MTCQQAALALSITVGIFMFAFMLVVVGYQEGQNSMLRRWNESPKRDGWHAYVSSWWNE